MKKAAQTIASALHLIGSGAAFIALLLGSNYKTVVASSTPWYANASGA
jgi:hypothetical protein